MILDAFLQFSNAQALTATAASSSYIDLGSDRNIGVGKPLCVVITLDVAADFTTGDETYVAALQTDSSSGFGSAVSLGSVTILGGSAAGSKFVIPVPPDARADRYLRMNYTLAGTTPSVTLSAELQPQDAVQNDFYFASGYTVS